MSAGKKFRRGCRLDDNDNLDIFFAGKNSPWRGLGRASMPGRWRGREAPMPGRNVMLESISGTYAFEVPRNWKQAPTIFWLLPAWSSELETGMSHFFGVAPRGVPRGVPLNPGVTTGLKEAILLRCRAGAAGLLCRAAGASQPLAKKSVLQSSPQGTGFFFLGRIPTLARARQGSDAGQARPGFYARRGRHQAEPSQSPRALAICAICAISHKASH